MSSIKVLFLIALVVCCLFYLCLTQEASCTTPNNEPGTCKLFRRCAAIENQWTNNPSEELRAYVNNARCQKEQRGVRICCASPAAQQIPFFGDRNGAKVPANLNERGFNILNSIECGKLGTDRVANGMDAILRQFPWMALLSYDVPDYPYMCGGSLITDRYVLTAAHCKVGLQVELIGVRLGEHVISTDRDCQRFGRREVCNPPVEDFGIAEAKPHPDYDRTLLINDIMLLKLDRKVIFKDHIQPICLPITERSTRLEPNQKFTIAGWGKLTTGKPSDVLQYGHLYVRTSSYCTDVYRRSFSENHICALGNNLLDSCRGDSGGPLFTSATYKTLPQYVQFGIVSFGVPGCGASPDRTYPGIYANVTTQLPWITANID